MTTPSAADRTKGVAAVFDSVADTYDTVDVPWFRPIGQRLLTEVKPTAGASAVDLGCGRGAVLFPLAEAVGPTGTVLGIDVSAAMLAATQRDIDRQGLQNVTLRLMDASAPDLPPGSYDLLTASLVLFFLPDPVAALRSWRALLRPGGQVGVSTFGGRDPRWEDVDDLFVPYLPPHLLDARTSGKSGPFGSDDGVEKLFADAGYAAVRTVDMALATDFSDVQTWERWTWSHGQRVMWEAVPSTDRGSVRAAAFARLEGCRDADGRILLSQTVRLTIAGV